MHKSSQCRRSSRAEFGGSFQGTPILDVDTKVIGNSVFADVGDAEAAPANSE
jgi:hypothetical protein